MNRRTPTFAAFALLALLAGACSSTVTGEPESSSSGATSSSGASGSSSGGIERDAGSSATRPPPVVTDVAPRAGDYGAVVTITGDNLDEASAVVSLSTPTEPLELRANDPNVVRWTKTEIAFRYPFPAEGGIHVQTASGQADGESFEPSWRPGSPLSGVFSRRETLAVVSPAPGKLVAAFDGATGPLVVVADADGTVSSQPLGRGTATLFQASLYVTPSGTVDGFFANDGKLWRITDAAGALATTNTGVAADVAAGGQDATGPYAWIRVGSGVLGRVRPPSWTADMTVTDPTPAGAPGPSIAVGPDQSLYVGWGVNTDGSFPTYDHQSHPVTRRLRPGQTTFDSERVLGDGADDYMAWTRFRAGPNGRVASYYCANDTNAFGTNASWDCGEGYVSDVVPPSGATVHDYVVGWNATTSFATMCETATNTTSVGPEGDSAQQKAALYPCPHVTAVTVDPTGAGVFVVWSGKYLYAPKKR